MQLHHLALGAKNVEKIAEFYTTFFDLVEDRRHHDEQGELRSIWLQLESGVLMVERVFEIEPPVDMRTGLFLIAFTCSKSEQTTLEKRLSNCGYPIESRTDYTSYLRDPEGNRVALSCYSLSNEP